MPVLINWKICDNSKDCNGISVCKHGVFSWNEKKKTIELDNSKCILCGSCAKCCPVHAIHFVKTQEEYNKAKKEIEADPRKMHDLFVDRYGAAPVDPAFNISPDKFDIQILQASKPAVAELFKSSGIKCLLHSIPYKQILDDNVKLRKVCLDSDTFLQNKYNINQLPAMLFFNNGKLLGKIEGYYNEDQKSELKKKIDEILKT